jgi:hypothetical protein
MERFAATKDPDAILDYEIDWNPILEDENPVDTINGSSWATDGTITIDGDSYTDTHATAWISGGTLKDYCNLVNTITTVGLRTHVRTIKFSVKDT